MAEFRRGEKVDLGQGLTLRGVGVGGSATAQRPGQADQRRSSRVPATLGSVWATGPSQLSSAIDNAGLSLHAVVELPDLRPAPVGATRGSPGPRVELDVARRSGQAQVLLERDGTGRLRWHVPVGAGEARGATRATRSDRFAIPVDGLPTDPVDDGTRSGRGRLRTALYVLRFPVEIAAGWAAAKAVGLWERRHRPYGLHLLNRDGSLGAEATPQLLARAGDGPFLMLVHGLFGKAKSTFGGLLSDADTIAAVHDHYAGRALVFDHPTLHVSPAANAEWLRSRLPTDRPLTMDVVAHSRGGLVTRQLGLPGALTLGTVVHVGVPNAGTTLASPKRLGSLIDVVTNLVSLFPEPASSIVVDAVLEVVKQLAQGVLGGPPGINAMDPANAELALLNENPAAAAVHAVTTDYEPGASSTLAEKALDLAIDALFGAPNDLVVPTEGVFKAGSYIVPDPVVARAQGHERPVTHSTFFGSGQVREQIREWLVG